MVPADNEKELWCAVLDQAIRDAVNGEEIAARPKDWSLERYERHVRATVERARSFFDACNNDFRLVCELAGMIPEFVLQKMEERFAANPVEDIHKRSLARSRS